MERASNPALAAKLNDSEPCDNFGNPTHEDPAKCEFCKRSAACALHGTVRGADQREKEEQAINRRARWLAERGYPFRATVEHLKAGGRL